MAAGTCQFIPAEKDKGSGPAFMSVWSSRGGRPGESPTNASKITTVMSARGENTWFYESNHKGDLILSEGFVYRTDVCTEI